MSMITATTWVPRGFAAQFPTKYEFNEEEFSRISKLAQRQLEDAQEDLEDARNESMEGITKKTKKTKPKASASSGASIEMADTNTDMVKEAEAEADEDIEEGKTNGDLEDADDDLKEYDLDHYDDPEISDADMADDDDDLDIAGGDTMGMFGNIKSLVYHGSNDEDPYITLRGNGQNPDSDDDSDDDREDLQVLPTDNLVLAARVEDEVAHLEVYVYEDEADNLYVHHDIMLPAIPLAVEWLDFPVGKADSAPGARGNFVAVGTMDPDIELWDLDTVDCMYPNAILGAGGGTAQQQSEAAGTGKKKKRKSKSKKPTATHHVDAVLSLAANRAHRNLLASASADTTVKLWDLNTAKCAQSYSYHTDKVCSLAWHPVETTALLSGSYDKSVVVGDMRAPEQGQRRWLVDSDVENVKWDPHDSNNFYVSTESGLLYYFDARTTPSKSSSPSPALFRLQAHATSLSTFDINPLIPNYLATGSTDKTVKLWNISPSTGPSMVVSRDLDVGKVFSTQWAPDREVGWRLAVAGSKGSLRIWDTSTNKAVRETFAGRVGRSGVANGVGSGKEEEEEVRERLVGLAVDDDEDDSEEGEWEEDGEGTGKANGNGHDEGHEDEDED